jgi:hypothetical protein
VIHLLLVVAAVLLVLWIAFHAVGGAIHLLWLLILVAAVVWLLGFLRGGGRRSVI